MHIARTQPVGLHIALPDKSSQCSGLHLVACCHGCGLTAQAGACWTSPAQLKPPPAALSPKPSTCMLVGGCRWLRSPRQARLSRLHCFILHLTSPPSLMAHAAGMCRSEAKEGPDALPSASSESSAGSAQWEMHPSRLVVDRLPCGQLNKLGSGTFRIQGFGLGIGGSRSSWLSPDPPT